MSKYKYNDERAKRLRNHFSKDENRGIDMSTQIYLCIAEKFGCHDITDVGIEISNLMADFQKAMAFTATDFVKRGVYIKEDKDEV